MTVITQPIPSTAQAAAQQGPFAAAQQGPFPLIHAEVARHARDRAEATALVCGDERVDYRTLDRAADAYAAALAGYGVGPGDIVPVVLRRSPRQAATLLAILKLGAAYAAFDHRWPADRVAGLLGQLRARVVVADEVPLQTGTAAPTPAWRPPIETLARTAASAGASYAVEVAPDAAACVFFTSGTTGTPKGVVSPHQATTRLFGPGGMPGYAAGRVTFQSAPPAWDMFGLELWGMLVTGGTVVIVEDDYLMPGVVSDVIAQERVDTIFVTTSLFNLFVDLDPECFTGAGVVYTGGERLSPTHVRRFLAQHPDITLYNGYGPVESCVFATIHPLTPADTELPGGVPIGHALSGTEVYVVTDGRICAPGEEGELCLGGQGLARGYLGLPEVTAEKFAPVTVDGASVRVYHTGDLGFRDADGLLHYRGRADRQVKVRGYRIELGEIETAAMRVPGVHNAVVVPVPGEAVAWEGLALFYTWDESAAGAGAAGADPMNVTGRLGERLPAYLVPDTVSALPELPRTANGKVDGKALLALLDADGS